MPDRTAEFFAALELFRAQAPSKAQDNGSAPSVRGGAAAAGGSHALHPRRRLPPSKFAQASSQVAKDIQRVQRSVSRLEHLAAKKSLLNDPAEEIGTLTANVKAAVASLTDQLGALRGFVDRPQGARPSRHCRAHWSVQVDTFRDALSRCTDRFLVSATQRASCALQPARGLPPARPPPLSPASRPPCVCARPTCGKPSSGGDVSRTPPVGPSCS